MFFGLGSLRIVSGLFHGFPAIFFCCLSVGVEEINIYLYPLHRNPPTVTGQPNPTFQHPGARCPNLSVGGTPGSGILCRTSPSDQCTLSRADGYASRYRSGAGTGTGTGGWGWMNGGSGVGFVLVRWFPVWGYGIRVQMFFLMFYF